MIAGGTMMDHLPGVVHHHHLEEALLLREDLHFQGRCTQRWGWWSLEKEKCFPKRLSSKTRITTKIDDDGPSRRDFGERDGGGCWRSGPPRDEPSRGGDRYCGAPKGGGRDFSEYIPVLQK